MIQYTEKQWAILRKGPDGEQFAVSGFDHCFPALFHERRRAVAFARKFHPHSRAISVEVSVTVCETKRRKQA